MNLEVLRSSGLVTVQDLGRFGWAHLGVPRAGALDSEAAALANRILDNPPSAAVLELTLGAIALRVDEGRWFAVTGARSPLDVSGQAVAFGAAVYAGPGSVLRVRLPDVGARAYLAVSGGIEVEPVLGSRSRDTLAGLGPPPVEAGTRLPVGPPTGEPQPHDVPRERRAGPLRIWPGSRADWFAAGALDDLTRHDWRVGSDSNRIGARLDGPAPERIRTDELPSEGMVLGAVQVPPDGRPVVLLHDHPVTGGYPVLAVVDERDLWQLAQARPGDVIRFARARSTD